MATIFVHPSPDGGGYRISMRLFQGEMTSVGGETYESAEHAFSMVSLLKAEMAAANVQVIDHQPDEAPASGPALDRGAMGTGEYVGGLSRFARGGAVTLLPSEEQTFAYGAGQPANVAGDDGGYYEQSPEQAIETRRGSTSLPGQEQGVPKASPEEIANATDARMARNGLRASVTRRAEEVRPFGGATDASRPPVVDEGNGEIVQGDIDTSKAGAARVDDGSTGGDTVGGGENTDSVVGGENVDTTAGGESTDTTTGGIRPRPRSRS